MPIEIKELHIRVAVNTTQGAQLVSSKQTSSGGSKTDSDAGAAKDAIIAECVEQVLHILQQKKER